MPESSKMQNIQDPLEDSASWALVAGVLEGEWEPSPQAQRCSLAALLSH